MSLFNPVSEQSSVLGVPVKQSHKGGPAGVLDGRHSDSRGSDQGDTVTVETHGTTQAEKT